MEIRDTVSPTPSPDSVITRGVFFPRFPGHIRDYKRARTYYTAHAHERLVYMKNCYGLTFIVMYASNTRTRYVVSVRYVYHIVRYARTAILPVEIKNTF